MTSDSLDAIRQRWIDERPGYKIYCQRVVNDVRRVLADHGIVPNRVSPRVKEVDSLVRKIPIRGFTSYDQIHDKAGVRVVVHLAREVDKVRDAIAEAFGVAPEDIQDKRKPEGTEPDRFTYRAVHVQIRRLSDYSETDKECEIQVRTVCEDAWAIMSHFLQYKAEQDVPIEVRRAQAALSAVFELADREYERQYDALHKQPGFEVRDLIDQISSEFVRLSGSNEFDPEVSESVVTTILPAWGDENRETIGRRIVSFSGEYHDALQAAFERGRDNISRSAYLFQPESLMIAERLVSGAGTDVRELWVRRFFPAELERLAADLEMSID